MITDRWRQIESLFTEAMAQPPSLRAPFIERRCGDAAVRDELVSLIDAAEASDGFLAAPAIDAFARQVSREGWTVRVGERVGAYTITERIGAGGMGEVWRARDERLGRDVALKLLLPHATDVSARSRAFEREARAAGGLNHPNVLTVYDIGEHRGAPFIVMECLEGRTLRARLAAGPLPIDEALRVALQVARGLHAAHARGIVHRDLKPENIFLTSDGGVKIVDFGIAAFAADEGIAAGTPGYVAPEQLRGGAIDARADIFAFGAVLREITAEIPRALADLIARCVEPSAEDRIGTLQEVIAGLESIVRQRQPPQSRALLMIRRPAVIAGLIVVTVAAGAGAWSWYRAAARVRWAHMTAAPEIRRLAAAGNASAAFLLAHEARQAAPGDPQLDQLWTDVTMTVNFVSDPDGADVVLSTYRTAPEQWLPLGRTPLRDVRIPRGLARIRVTKARYEPFEGTAHPQPDIRIRLDPVGGTPPGMVRVSGGRDPVRFGALPSVDDFWIDRFEVTNRDFKAFVDAGGYGDRSHWREPLVDEGRALSWDAAMTRFRDRTGRPGPATWTNGTYPEGQADFPVGGVSWYEAAAYARFAGKSLPTMYHWYRAAALGRFFDILPLSNFAGAGAARVGAYAGLGPFGTFDMAGNVKEWCWNASGSRRFALGGGWNEPRYMYADYDARPPFDRAANLGFRLAKYERPLPAAAAGPVMPLEAERAVPPPPVSDEVFEVYRRQYAYDATPLNATIEATEENERWTRTTVTFDAAYGGERMLAHLFLPRGARPPYQTVVFFGGADGFRLRSSRDMPLGPAEQILRSGRAFLYPVYKGTYERQASEVAGLAGRRERRIAVYRDLARSIDYLETRPDIDRNRLAFYGISAGGHAGVFLTALESRFKASVLQGAGLDEARAPEIDLRNFAPRVRVPTLLLCGRYDFELPYETAQRPLIELLGPPAAHKRHAAVESGHAIPQNDVLREMLPWLDRYLGPVAR
jgi:dienelactone hydrolase/aminoglycoside phosphotransferase (APT) family kinase protein